MRVRTRFLFLVASETYPFRHCRELKTWPHCTVVTVWICDVSGTNRTILRPLMAPEEKFVIYLSFCGTSANSLYVATMEWLWRLFLIKQDWPVASELVPGGMHFPFCLQRARHDHPIRRKVPRENQWKKTSSSGVSKQPSCNQVTVKQLEIGFTSK